MPAGELQNDGSYPEGTVHHRAELRLADMAKKAKEYGRGLHMEGDDDDEGDGFERWSLAQGTSLSMLMALKSLVQRIRRASPTISVSKASQSTCTISSSTSR